MLQLAVGQLRLDVKLLQEAVHPVLSQRVVVNRLALAHRLRLFAQLTALVQLVQV